MSLLRQLFDAVNNNHFHNEEDYAELGEQLSDILASAPQPQLETIIDSTGRIFTDGHLVGWLNKDAYPVAAADFAALLGVSAPPRQDMIAVEEVEK